MTGRALTRRELTALREILDGDITAFPTMEAKTIEICNRIAGKRGEPGNPPDPVIMLEYIAEILAAGMADARIVL